jgi:hypothetical protein
MMEEPLRKRRRKDEKAWVNVESLFIRLSCKTISNFLLNDDLLFDVANVKWIQWNGQKMEYLYFILEIDLDVRRERLKIKYMPNGMNVDEDDDGWVVCNEELDILGGWYVVEAGDRGIITKKGRILTL